MKKVNLFCISLLVFVGLPFLVMAQSENYESTKWYKDFSRAIEISDKTNSFDQVSLISFQLMGTIQTESDKEHILETMFSKEKASTLQLEPGSSKTLGFVKFGDVYNSNWQKIMDTVPSRIVLGETGVVKLVWLFKGETRTSYGIVDDNKGLLWDTIECMVIDYSHSHSQPMTNKVVVIKK